MHAIKSSELLKLASHIDHVDVTEVINDFSCLPLEWITDILVTEAQNIEQITVEFGTFITNTRMFHGMSALCNAALSTPAVIRYTPRDTTQPVGGLLHYTILKPSGGLYDRYPKDAPVWLNDHIKVQYGKIETDDGEPYSCTLAVRRDMYIIYTNEDPQMPEFSPVEGNSYLVLLPGKYYACVTAAAYSDILDKLNMQKIKSHVVYQNRVDPVAMQALQIESIAGYSAVMAAVHQNRFARHIATVHHSRVMVSKAQVVKK